jgi:hypothetical protein
MYYNHRLYYPDPEYGGGRVMEEIIKERSDGQQENGGYDNNGGTGRTSYNINDPSAILPDQIKQIVVTEPEPSTPTRKKIKNIIIDKVAKLVNTRGEVRKIKVLGEVGATFTLTLKDDSDCSILEDEMENVDIPSNGKYEFDQIFPSLSVDSGAAKSKVVYNLEITPAADTELGDLMPKIKPNIKLYQYADPIVTITTTSSATSPALSVASSPTTFTKTSGARILGRELPGYSSTTYTLTVTEDSSTAGTFYVKNANLNSNVTTNTVIKKTVDRCGATGMTHDLTLDPLSTRTDTSIEGEDFITGDLEAGMNFYGKVEYDKTVLSSIGVDSCYKATDQFELNETSNLSEGMIVSGGEGFFDAEIVSVDCDKNITLDKKYIIKENTVLTFKREWWGSIKEVFSNVNSKGQAHINIHGGADIVDGTVLEFDDNETILHGTMAHSGSGTDTIVLTSTVDVVRFGVKNVTYTLDLDNIISRKPNAYDQSVSTKKDTAIAIDMIKDDKDSNRTSKTGTVVTSPKYGTMSAYLTSSDSFRYTPNTGFTGEDSFTFTMSDGTTSSEEKTIRITVK